MKKYRSSITNVRSYQDADCDMEHFLVICQFCLELQRASRYLKEIPKFNIEEIKDEEKRQKYIIEITGKLNDRLGNEKKENWNIIKRPSSK